MSYDGSPEHLTWDGLDEAEAKEVKSGAENAHLRPLPRRTEFSSVSPAALPHFVKAS